MRERRLYGGEVYLDAQTRKRKEPIEGLHPGSAPASAPGAEADFHTLLASSLELPEDDHVAELKGPTRHRETLLSSALAAGQIGYWELDLRSRQHIASHIHKANWGRTATDTFTYDGQIESLHPDDIEGWEKAMADAIATRTPLDVECRNIWPDGSVHWIHVRGQAVYDRDGTPLRFAGVSLDVTEHKQIEESLREETRTLEILNRTGAALAGALDLQHVVQTVTDAATELSGAQFGSFFYSVIDEAGEASTLYATSGVARENASKFPVPRGTALFDTTFRDKAIIRSEDIRTDPRHGGNIPHFGLPLDHAAIVSYLAVPVIARSGEVLGGLFFGHERTGVFTERAERIVTGIAAQAAIAIDNARLFQSAQNELTERRRVEKHQELLLAELNHRVKNTLAIVLSMATQTLRHAKSTEAFRSGFEARIMALAEAHNLLTDSNWRGSSLEAIIRRVLDPYSDRGAARYIIEAEPDVQVGPRMAVSLVMAVNELATNAAKYGALSNAHGHIKIGWRIAGGGETPRLQVRWEETDGPPLRQPTRTGFGSRLIRELARDTDGQVTMDFSKTGLICTFDFPVPARSDQ